MINIIEAVKKNTPTAEAKIATKIETISASVSNLNLLSSSAADSSVETCTSQISLVYKTDLKRWRMAYLNALPLHLLWP